MFVVYKTRINLYVETIGFGCVRPQYFSEATAGERTWNNVQNVHRNFDVRRASDEGQSISADRSMYMYMMERKVEFPVSPPSENVRKLRTLYYEAGAYVYRRRVENVKFRQYNRKRKNQ